MEGLRTTNSICPGSESNPDTIYIYVNDSGKMYGKGPWKLNCPELLGDKNENLKF